MFSNRRRTLSLLLLICFCVFLTGCDRQGHTAVTSPPPTTPLKFRIGLIPEHNLFEQKKRYAPLLNHLSHELGVTFEIVILPRYGNSLDSFNDLRLDGAFLGSFTGALAIEKFGVEPIARPQYVGGASTYYGVIFVRRGSGIRGPAEMQGKKMVFVDRATTAGYLLPLSYFKSLGIRDYTALFSEYYFSGTHEDAVQDVLSGAADIGAAKNTVFYQMAATNPRILDELEILATSPRVPSNGLMLRKDFPRELKLLMQRVLLACDQTRAGKNALKELRVEKFIETSAKDYQPVLTYAQSIGLNLASYSYPNH